MSIFLPKLVGRDYLFWNFCGFLGEGITIKEGGKMPFDFAVKLYKGQDEIKSSTRIK